MSRKHDNSPTISFFSFQDIITSVTGIMFLVVLMLILMLLMYSSESKEQRQEEANLSKLVSELERLQGQVKQSQLDKQALEAQMKTLDSLKLDEVHKRFREASEFMSRLDNELLVKTQQREDIQRRLTELKNNAPETEAKLQLTQQQLTEKKKNMTALIESVKKIEKDIKVRQKRVRFTWTRQTNKKPLLVECGAKNIRVGMLGDTKPFKEITAEKEQLLQGKLLKFLEGYDKNQYYVFLLAKPGAFSYVESISAHLLKRGYERGREVLPDEESTIFQEAVK